MKINPEGVELFYEDGQTDRQTGIYDEVMSRFLQLCDRGQQFFLITH